MLRLLSILVVACLLSGANCLSATDVTVSVADDGFVPVDLEMTATHAFNTGAVLSPDKPAAVTAEPVYQGGRHYYGYFNMGTAANHRYYFSVDILSSVLVHMYFDLNHNGNLADDGGPILNEGTGLFAARINIPFHQLVAESAFTGDFATWVYGSDFTTNEDNQIIEHYSRTQLKGTVRLGGQVYTAYLADRGYNDADLTNDGIYIDLDGNGTIDDTEEWFWADQLVNINGKNYEFHIAW